MNLVFSHFVLEMVNELEHKLEQLKVANQKLHRNSRGSVTQVVHDESILSRRSSSSEIDEPIHIRAQDTNSAQSTLRNSAFVSLICTFALWMKRRY